MSSMKTFVAFLLLISGYAWAAMSTVSNNAFYISHVEPTKNFMVSFLDNFEDLPASRAGTSNAIISRFHAAAKQSEFSKAMMSQTGVSRLTATIDETPRQLFGDRLRVRFQAYDEDFDLTLSVNRDIIDPQRTRVYAGVPGNLTTHIPHYTFYSSSLTDLEGEQTIASFTVLDDLRLEGMIVRDGETYSVSPVEFLQAEVTTDAKTGRSATLDAQSLARVAAVASQGMVVYRHSDLNAYDASGKPFFQCGSIAKEGDHADHYDHAGGHEGAHVDPVQPLTVLFPDMATPASSPGRSPLLKRWTDCHTAAGGYGKKMYLDLVVDYGAALFYSDSDTTVDLGKVTTRLGSVVSQVSAVYYAQMGVQFVMNTVEVRNTMTTEVWNVYGGDDPRWAQKNINATDYVAATQAYRQAQDVTKKGATQQFITRAFLTGTVGMAYIGVLCETVSSTGFSSINNGLFLTLAHEIGHNFNARHTFETCTQDGTANSTLLYTSKTGGIMDYSNGVLGSESDSNGEIGFHSLCNKKDMCDEIVASFTKVGGVPVTQCWADMTSSSPVCGNRILEAGEECDTGSFSSSCCVNCKYAAGATCAYPSDCCVNCQAKTANTTCGAGGKGHCGPEGTCVASLCSYYSNTQYNGGVTANTVCTESCINTNTGTAGNFGFVNKELCNLSSGGTGYCKSSTCTAITYDWSSYPTTCACDAASKPPVPAITHCKAVTGAIVADSLCSTTPKPTSISCCNYDWSVGTWGTCNCVTNTQTRSVTCINTSYNNAAVADSLCSTPKPATSQSCPCLSYAWKCAAAGTSDTNMATADTCTSSDTTTGFQSSCPVVCGSGNKTRRVACVGSDGSVYADTLCTTSSTKPASTQACTGPTCTYAWKCGSTGSFADCTASHFGACSTSCGSGTQTRTVTCVRTNDNSVAADTSCPSGSKPTTSQTCTGTSCTYAWKCAADTTSDANMVTATTCTSSDTTTGFQSTCPVDVCGSGTKTRRVACVSSGGAIVADSQCTNKPATTQACTGPTCTYAWKCGSSGNYADCTASHFGTCDVACGSGTQTRTVTCVRTNDNSVAADTSCPSGSKPTTSQTCTGTNCANVWKCAATGTSDANMVTATTCTSSDTTTGFQSTCPVVCGPGEKTRRVACVSSAGVVLADSQCTNKPATTQACSGPSCNFAWKCGTSGNYADCTASHFGACSTNCGDGSQTRTVTCVRTNDNTAAAAESSCSSSSKPTTSQSCTSTSGCTYKWRCAPDASSDFSAAPTCSSSADAGYGACQVSCPSGTQSRVKKCWSSIGAVVADSNCSADGSPVLSRSCTGATTFANIAIGTATPTAGAQLKLNWCYHGTSQNVDIMFGLNLLGTVSAGSGTATVTLPWGSKRSGATVRLVAADGTAVTSPPFDIASRCDSLPCGPMGTCDEQKNICECSAGWSGSDCTTSPCDVSQCENGAYCSNDGPLMGQCQCRRGFEGSRCRTRIAYGVLSVAVSGGTTPAASKVHVAVDEAWKTSLITEISTRMSLPIDRVSIARTQDVKVDGQAAVEVVFAFASVDGATESDMVTIYDAWTTTSVQLTVNSSIANVGLVVSMQALYDPNCTGNTVTCPSGQDPFATSGEEFDMWIIYYIIIGVGSLILISTVIVTIICCRRRRQGKRSHDVNADITEMSEPTAVVHNARISVANNYEATYSPTPFTPVVPPTHSATQKPTVAAPYMPASQTPSTTQASVAPQTIATSSPPVFVAHHNSAPAVHKDMAYNPNKPVPVFSAAVNKDNSVFANPAYNSAPAATPLNTTAASLEIRPVTTASTAPPPFVKPPASLPPGWVECKTDDGQYVYFWNEVTGESVWERPTH